LEPDLPARDLAVRREQPQQRGAERGLAAAGLADDAEDLAGRDAELDVAERRQRRLARVVDDVEALDLEQGPGHGRRHRRTPASRGSTTSRRVSPNIVNPSVVTIRASPVQSTGQGVSRTRSNPSARIAPHDGVGGCTPSPRNDSPDSTTIA